MTEEVSPRDVAPELTIVSATAIAWLGLAVAVPESSLAPGFFVFGTLAAIVAIVGANDPSILARDEGQS